MAVKKKASNEQIIESYKRLGNVWKVAEELGMCGQSVHERLQKLGVDTSMNVFTEEDAAYLSDWYVICRDVGQLQTLADEMGRTKQFICRQARKLGLTKRDAPKDYLRKWKNMPYSVAVVIWEDFKRSRKTVTDYCIAKHYGSKNFHDVMNKYFPDEYDMVIDSKKPKSTRYARGRSFEYAVRDDMAKHGYLALRSPASKSPADIYCIKAGELVFIQCKLHGALYRDEWNKFFTFCDSVSAVPIMARRHDSGRGIEYFELLDFKDEFRRKSPMKEWHPTNKEQEMEEEG